MRGFQSLPFGDCSSEVYAKVRAEPEGAGKPIGPNDLLISATAIANQVILVAHNTKEFGRVAGWQGYRWKTGKFS